MLPYSLIIFWVLLLTVIIYHSYRCKTVSVVRFKLIDNLYDTIGFLISNDYDYYKSNFRNRNTFQDYYWSYNKMIFYFWRNDFHNMTKASYPLLKEMREREKFIKQQKGVL